MTKKNRGLLLTNLGSPRSTKTKDVGEYLTEFLMDKRVMDFPYLLRLFLVRGIIVPRRAPQSAEAYRKVWKDEGSPLIIEAYKLTQKVRDNADFPVAISMRYGEPTTESAFASLLEQNPNLEEIVVLPLYPQYTMSSFGTAVAKIESVHRKKTYPFQLKFLNPFYNHPDYIVALATSIKPYLEKEYDKLLFSYHGLPERHLSKDKQYAESDKEKSFQVPSLSYREQAIETSRLVAKSLNIPTTKYEVSFQSRLAAAGKEWLKPYTVVRLEQLPGEGVKKLLVACPAFINDCLETIEEIGMDGKADFKEAGGESLTLIPCLNDQIQFAETVVNWVKNA